MRHHSFCGGLLPVLYSPTHTNFYQRRQRFSSLSSDNPNVATINSSGLGTALAPGTTYLRGSWSTGVYSWDSFLGTCVFDPLTAEAAAFCDVLSLITVTTTTFNPTNIQQGK